MVVGMEAVFITSVMVEDDHVGLNSLILEPVIELEALSTEVPDNIVQRP